MNQISDGFKNSILRLTLLFWIIFKLMSVNLWISWYRTFPELPVFEFLGTIPSGASDGLALLSFLLMLMALYNPKRIFFILIFGLEMILMSLDQMRWQPTLFQFLVTVLISLLRSKDFKFYFFFLLSVTYIFSGLHKLNLGFINFTWGKFFLIDFLGISPEIAFHRGVKAMGLTIPMIEILAGLLLWTRYKKLGWSLIIVMHILLLLVLGPLGSHINSIIWPWNILMIAFAILFLRQKTTPFSFNYFKSFTGAVLITILVVLPILSFVGRYSPYLSFSLYSGKSDYLYVHSSCLEVEKAKFKSIEFQEITYRNVFDWSMTELNIPMVPHIPVFEDFKHYFSQQCSGDSKYLIRTYPYKSKQTLNF